MLLRPTPLQQPTGPLQPCLRALLVSARPLPMLARPLLVSAPWMPDVPLALSQPRVAVPESETAEHENKTGGGRKIPFPGIMQEYSRMLLRPTPLQQPTGPLQLWPRALRVATPWSLGLLDSDILELRRQLARLPSKIFLSGGPQDGQDFGSGLGAQDLLDASEPGSSAPRSGEHLPAPREHAGELPRGRDRRRSDI